MCDHNEIHRDIKPQNVKVTPKDKIFLLAGAGIVAVVLVMLVVVAMSSSKRQAIPV